jgi:hypothetical protein
LEFFISHSLKGFFLNFATEIGGAVVTFILLNQIIGGRTEKERLKADLIAQLGSRVNEVALRAAEELRRHEWLSDGCLRGQSLARANLEHASLQMADFRKAIFIAANLKGTCLWEADLRGAVLWNARLEGARLKGALEEMHRSRNFKVPKSSPERTRKVRIKYLGRAKFDEQTVLPDGALWTPDTDMERFTNSAHPNFWHPNEDG